MSDIPELDRLIEESENVRRNKMWDLQDRIIRRTLGYFMLSLLLIIPLSILFGKYGAVAAIMSALVSTTPLLFWAIYILLHGCFIDPPPRDPTKRYMYK